MDAVVAAAYHSGDGSRLLLGELLLGNHAEVLVEIVVHTDYGGVFLVYPLGGDLPAAVNAPEGAEGAGLSEGGYLPKHRLGLLDGYGGVVKKPDVKGGGVAVNLRSVGGHRQHTELFKLLDEREEEERHGDVENRVEVRYAASVDGVAPEAEHPVAFKGKDPHGENHRADDVKVKVGKGGALGVL